MPGCTRCTKRSSTGCSEGCVSISRIPMVLRRLMAQFSWPGCKHVQNLIPFWALEVCRSLHCRRLTLSNCRNHVFYFRALVTKQGDSHCIWALAKSRQTCARHKSKGAATITVHRGLLHSVNAKGREVRAPEVRQESAVTRGALAGVLGACLESSEHAREGLQLQAHAFTHPRFKARACMLGTLQACA